MTKTVDGTWVSYSGTARIDLAIVLVAVAAGMVYAGTRLRRPVRMPRPSETAAGIMVVAWLLAITAFLACAGQYVSAMRQHHLLHGLPPHPISPVTGACAVVIFVTILIVARSHRWPVRLASAAIGAMAAPMVFEFPFDLIVMARTYPPIPPDPVTYRVLFFAPLFLVEFATLSFLTLAPMVRLTRSTVFSFALMLAVFAAWALSGFAFPATPGPFAFNALSKILAFTTALTLFLPQRSEASTSPELAPPVRSASSITGDLAPLSGGPAAAGGCGRARPIPSPPLERGIGNTARGRITCMSAALKSMITDLVSGLEPADDLGREHRRNALSWLAGTDDIFRRVKPLTPSPHLVSYFLLVDRPAGSVLLCDHRLSGLWLPTGGHVEPGEHPLGTIRREAVEELGVTAQPDAVFQDRPFFLTMTETVGPPALRHVDVSLWFALAGRVGQPLHPDQREFTQVRWWTAAELRHAGLDRFEPHLLRALDALGLGC